MEDYKERQLEMMINRMKRRQVQSATVHVPPIPLSLSVLIPDSSGLLGTMYLPAEGRITLIIGQVDSVLDRAIPSIAVRLESGGADTTRIYKIGVGSPVKHDDELLVHAGTKVYVVISDPDKMRGVWLSMLYQMELSQSARYQIALDDLLEKIEAEE